MKRLFLFLIVTWLSLGVHARMEGDIKPGEGTFTYQSYPSFATRPVDVHYYIPAGDVRRMPVVFVFEGADRGYGYLLKAWKEEAEKHKFMVFIPHFDVRTYPLSDYQEVGVMNANYTSVQPAGKQTPALIDRIYEYVRQETGSERKGYMLYGHSAGGQFVQRFMLFHDSPYVERAIIGSPGWYTFPDATQDFPYGVRNIPFITPERLKSYLAKPIVLQLASGDTIRETYLRKTPEAELQGMNRLERGNRFYQYLHQIAAKNNWPCHWRKIEEKGIGHHSAGMGRRAVPVLLSDSLRALFIGNSYTYYNKLIRQVQTIAASTGHRLSVKMIEHGGWKLSQHATSAETLDAIREGQWDFVIFQDQSKAPARESEWVREHVYKPAAVLDSLRRLYNPQGRTVFYMTWGHNIETYEEMQQRLAKSYLSMTNALNAWCAPVGIAFKRVRTERPGFPLNDPDLSHPSMQGTYLAANVFCSVFFRKTYTSTYWADLPKEEALYLQRTAQEVVFSNLSLWNIQPTAQPEAVTQHFYPEAGKKYPTPTLNKPLEEGLASLFEINRYLEALANKYPDKVTLTSVGTSPGGRDIPILYFADGQNSKKVKVWIQAGLHGNEPAGPEAACLLADYLLQTPEGNKLLDKVSLALIPVANADGYAIQERKSGSGFDLNRDQSKLSDPVTLLLKKAYRHWSPEVALDIHEFNPIRKEYNLFRGHQASVADDVLFLASGHLNIPVGLRSLSNGLFRSEAEQALKDNGYTSGFYFTPTVKDGTLYAVKDGKSPQSSSTFQALTNAVSLFIEIRGIGLGRTSLARRAECGFLVAHSILQTAATHDKGVKATIRRAIKETCTKNKSIFVTFHAPQTEYPVSFIDLGKKERFTQNISAFDAMQLQPDIVRERPEAYILADTCLIQAEKLRLLGVEVEQIEKPFTANVQKYIVSEQKADPKEWERIHPVRVTIRLMEEKKTFPAGCFLIRLAQKNANLAVTLLEPESENGFVHFRVIEAREGKELPVYRVQK